MTVACSGLKPRRDHLQRSSAGFHSLFILSAIVGRNSFIHRFQKFVARASANRHLFFNPKSASSKRSNGMFGLARPKSRWFGVNTSGSVASLVRYVSGLPLRIFSTIANVVTRTSSVTTCFAKIRTRARLADFTSPRLRRNAVLQVG